MWACSTPPFRSAIRAPLPASGSRPGARGVASEESLSILIGLDNPLTSSSCTTRAIYLTGPTRQPAAIPAIHTS